MNDTIALATLWEERAVKRVMLRFGRTLDLGDWAGHRSCLADTVVMDFKRLTGFEKVAVPADDWVGFAKHILSPVRRHHVYSNWDIEVKGMHATMTLNQTSRHWKSTDVGSADYTQYGTYDVEMEKRSDEWKIVRLKHDFYWSDGNNALFDLREPKLVESMQRVFSEANLAAAAAMI
jgi:SnoaL-like domain